MIAQSARRKISEDGLSGIRKRRKLLSSLYRIAPNGEIQDLMLQEQQQEVEEDPNLLLSPDYRSKPQKDDSQVDTADDQNNAEDQVERPIPKPDNITVTLFSWTPPSIRVGWDFHDPYLVIDLPTPLPDDPLTSASATTETSSESASVRNEEQHRKLRLEAFRIIYHPTVTKFRMIREIPPTFRNITIECLEPQTEYFLTIIALFQSPIHSELPPIVIDPSEIPASSSSSSHQKPQLPPNYYKLWGDERRKKPITESESDVIRFVSPDSEPGRFNRHSYRSLVKRTNQIPGEVSVKTDELVIVILVLCIWVTVIGVFIKKWGKIRAIEPCQSYYSPEIYDIPLKKSMGISSDTGLSPVGPGPSFDNNGCPSHHMTSTESRRSLTAASRRESYPAYLMTTHASCHPSGTHTSLFTNSANTSYFTAHGHRQRLNSVFVTPPTRPPTPLPGETSPRRFKSAEDLRSIVNEFTRRKSTLLMPPSYFQRHAAASSHHHHFHQ